MTSPPGVSPAPNPARPASKWTNTNGLDPVQVRQTVDAGQWLAGQWGLPIRRSRVRQLAIRFLREGRVDVDFRTWFISYADPTGESAVHNVMKEARNGRE